MLGVIFIVFPLLDSLRHGYCPAFKNLNNYHILTSFHANTHKVIGIQPYHLLLLGLLALVLRVSLSAWLTVLFLLILTLH